MAPFVGTWELIPESSDNIDKAVEKAIARMSFIARPIARGKLKHHNKAFSRTFITLSPDGLEIRHDGGIEARYPSPLVDVRAKDVDGGTVLTSVTPGPVMTLRYKSADGVREDQYILNEDRTMLTIAVRVASPRLPNELTYKLVFRKTS